MGRLTAYRRFISIHAPAKGATSRSINRLRVPKISIHAPAKGATGLIQKNLNELGISIHAPAKGATY